MTQYLKSQHSPSSANSQSQMLPADHHDTSHQRDHPLPNPVIPVEEDDDEYDFDYETLPENTTLASHLIAGAFAGIMVCILVLSMRLHGFLRVIM